MFLVADFPTNGGQYILLFFGNVSNSSMTFLEPQSPTLAGEMMTRGEQQKHLRK